MNGAETIPQLPQTIGLVGPEMIEVVQGGVSARTTVRQIANLGGPTGPTGPSLTGEQIAALTNPVIDTPVLNSLQQTLAEQAVGAVPTNYAYAPLDVRRYGAVGNLVADDTVPINTACLVAATQGGGIVWIDGSLRCLVNSGNINVGNGVALHGPHDRGGYVIPPSTAGLQATGGSIWLNPSYTINLAPGTGAGSSVAGGASVRGLSIFRVGLTIPTTDAEATAALAAFAGTAITITAVDTANGDVTGVDCYVGYCNIIGFTYAIYSTRSDRFVAEYVNGDCTNGIYLNNTLDLARIFGCEFFPFICYPFGLGNEFWRSGTAFYMDTGAQWTQLINCYAYCYQVGYQLNARSLQVISCGSDGHIASIPANCIGFSTGGAATDIKIIGCQSAVHELCYYLNATGEQLMDNCSAWGLSNGQVVVTGNAGIVNIQGGYFYNNNGATGCTFITINSGVAKYYIGEVVFDGRGFVTTSTNIASSVTGQVGINTYVNQASNGGGPVIQNNVLISSATTTLQAMGDVTPNLQLNGTGQAASSYGGVYWNNNGNPPIVILGKSRSLVPGTYAIVNSGDQLGLIRFLGDDGTALQPGAQIYAVVNASPGAGSMPTTIHIQACAPGSVSPADVMTLSTAGTTVSGPFACNGNSPAAQSTGWGTPTNGAVINNFNASTATSTQVAQAVSELLLVLKSSGILGS
jgi:hypothetical protein